MHWLHPSKKSTRKKHNVQQKDQLRTNGIGLSCLRKQNPGLREADLETSLMRGSDKTSMLRQGKKTTTAKKTFPTAWIHIQDPSPLKDL